MSTFQQLLESVYDLLYPPRCVSCQAAGSHFCADCQAKLLYIRAPLCQRCGYPKEYSQAPCHQCQSNPLRSIDAIRSVAFFDHGPLRAAIHKFKYQNRQVLSKEFAPLLANCYTKHQLKSDVIIPVPLHKNRYKYRGYNQSTLLAKELSKLIGQPLDSKTLVKHRATETQMSLKAQKRKTNVANAFVCRTGALESKNILLIDDVCTTGATLEACAQALKQANVHSVYGLTLARAV